MLQRAREFQRLVCDRGADQRVEQRYRLCHRDGPYLGRRVARRRAHRRARGGRTP